MKKILILVIFLSVPLLSGCSLIKTNSSSNTNNTASKINPNNAIWTSSDAGKKWDNNNESTTVSIASIDVISMAINPYDENNVFVGTTSSGIFTTTDGGKSWSKLKFIPEKVYGLSIDPNDPKILYASGLWNKRGKIFKSIDSGANWTELYTTPAEGPLISALMIDKKNSQIIYAATSEKQIIKTTNGGDTWQNIFESKSPVTKMVLDRENENLLYAVSLDGDVLRSKDGGKSFEYLKNSFTGLGSNSAFTPIETDPNNSGVVYLGGKNGIQISKDGGNTWNEIKTLDKPSQYPVRAIAINPNNSEEIIYGAAKAAYHSLDGGKTWETFQFDLSANVNIIQYSNNPSRLYLGFKSK